MEMVTNNKVLEDLREILLQFTIPKKPDKIEEYSSNTMDELYRIWNLYDSRSKVSGVEDKYDKFFSKLHYHSKMVENSGQLLSYIEESINTFKDENPDLVKFSTWTTPTN